MIHTWITKLITVLFVNKPLFFLNHLNLVLKAGFFFVIKKHLISLRIVIQDSPGENVRLAHPLVLLRTAFTSTLLLLRERAHVTPISLSLPLTHIKKIPLINKGIFYGAAGDKFRSNFLKSLKNI